MNAFAAAKLGFGTKVAVVLRSWQRRSLLNMDNSIIDVYVVLGSLSIRNHSRLTQSRQCVQSKGALRGRHSGDDAALWQDSRGQRHDARHAGQRNVD
jgi:hypothetical protein